MLTDSQKTEFTVKVRECLRKAFDMWLITDVKPDDVEIRYDLDGHTAGYSGSDWGMVGTFPNRKAKIVKHWLRFNVQAMEQHWDDMVSDTIPHEVAHTVVHILYEDRIIAEHKQYQKRRRVFGRKGAREGHLRPHGPEWKQVAQSIGCNGKRCHSYELKKSRRTKWYEYKSTDGEIKAISAIRHGKLQRHSRYFIFWKQGDHKDYVYGTGWTGRVFWDRELKDKVN